MIILCRVCSDRRSLWGGGIPSPAHCRLFRRMRWGELPWGCGSRLVPPHSQTLPAGWVFSLLLKAYLLANTSRCLLCARHGARFREENGPNRPCPPGACLPLGETADKQIDRMSGVRDAVERSKPGGERRDHLHAGRSGNPWWMR